MSMYQLRDIEEDALRDAVYAAFDRLLAALGTADETTCLAAFDAAQERFEAYIHNPPKQVVMKVEPI